VKPGDAADFVEIDLEHPEVADVESRDLPSALVFGTGSGVVAASWVAGRRVYAREENG
jgi:cytosine/adenosine deaminase-related metal-dependent hydrolase